MVRLCCRPYCKALGTYQYVPWKSAHSPAVKRAFIYGELCRRIRLCTMLEDWKRTVEDLKLKLQRRGYPDEFLMEIINKFHWDGMHSLREKTTEKILKVRSPGFAWKQIKIPPSMKITIPLIIRYDPRIFNAMKEYKKALEKEIGDKLQKHRFKLKFEMRIVMAYAMGRKLLNVISKPSKRMVNIHSTKYKELKEKGEIRET